MQRELRFRCRSAQKHPKCVKGSKVFHYAFHSVLVYILKSVKTDHKWFLTLIWWCWNPLILSAHSCSNLAASLHCAPVPHFSLRATRSRSNILAMAAISPPLQMWHTFSCSACITFCFGTSPAASSHVELQRDSNSDTTPPFLPLWMCHFPTWMYVCMYVTESTETHLNALVICIWFLKERRSEERTLLFLYL